MNSYFGLELGFVWFRVFFRSNKDKVGEEYIYQFLRLGILF